MFLTSSWILDFIIFCATSAFMLYKYFARHFDLWKKKGVKYPKPIPFVGNFYDIVTFKTTVQELLKKYYDQFDEPYFGIFMFDEPALVLKSPKLIKDVMIKDFSVFCDKRVATPRYRSMAHSVFFLKYGPWKKIRSKLSPLFSTGPLKNMHTHIVHINELMTDFLHKNAGLMDVRIIGGHFATELMVRCFYGADPHCFDQETSQFRKYIFKLFDFNFRNALVANLYFIKPKLASWMRLKFIEQGAITFFEKAFKDSMNNRPEHNGKPHNLLDLAIKGIKEKQEGKPDAFDFDMAVSNAILFLIGGQETTSTLVNFTLYELAIDQDIQERLRNEIKTNFETFGGFTFEGILENKYLEMCINESLRKYTALPFLDRMAMSDYRFEGTDLVIKKGTSVLIPFFALHRDEKYYPNAEKYDPDRFSDNSTINVDGLNFIPFGEGPRICIGKRLGTIALAMCLSNIILKFKIDKCPATPEKIEFEPKNFALISKVGLPLKITPL